MFVGWARASETSTTNWRAATVTTGRPRRSRTSVAGRKAEAEAAVPDALVDDVALCGPRERIRERLGVWKEAGVSTLMVGGDVAALRVMSELAP